MELKKVRRKRTFVLSSGTRRRRSNHDHVCFNDKIIPCSLLDGGVYGMINNWDSSGGVSICIISLRPSIMWKIIKNLRPIS